MTAPPEGRRRPPLEGLLVVDLSRVLAGPLCTMVLADLGARVVKVESPEGDVTRTWAPPSHDGESAYYLSINRRKESVVADLDTREGVELVRRLSLEADVLVENFRPGALERRGLSPEALRRASPRLVVCTISGWGESGPLAGEPGFDLVAQGASGLMSITGPADGEPHKVGVALADVLTGWAAATAVLAALAARERDGMGAHVRTSLFEASAAALVNVSQAALVTGEESARHGNAHPSLEPYRPFHASDGPFLLAVGSDRQFAALAEVVLKRPELARDPRFETNEDRVRNRIELVRTLEGLFGRASRTTWIESCRAAGVPAGVISGVLEALTSPQARAASLVEVFERAGHAPVPSVRGPIRLDGFDEPERAAPPRLDEDGPRLRASLAGS